MGDSLVTAKFLIYVVDPMCSWCWGFSPILEAVVRKYRGRVPVQVMLGGLRPGNTIPFDAQKREYILGHWRAVHERTGQPFNFTFHMSSDFTYDTEPSSRAVRVVRQLAPTHELTYLKGVQEAFYVKNCDVTRETVLREIAEGQGVDPAMFSMLFRDSHMKQETWREFAQARKRGVDGFPTLLSCHGKTYSLLMQGYQALDQLTPVIDHWLTDGNEINT